MKTEVRQQQTLVIVALVVVGLFVGDKVLFTPLYNLWKSRSSEIVELRKNVKDGKRLINWENDIRGQWASMQTNSLPPNPSVGQEQVLQAIVSWSQESGVTLNANIPQWKNDADEYRTLICRVDAVGTMWTISKFLYDIEKGPMGLKVESLDLSSHDNSGQQLTLSLQISALMLTPPKPK